VVSVKQRPQRDVPGFEGALTCAADWPATKNGRPPNAQSLIFNPLLACVLGPIEGHCTAQELEHASAWWAAALPAWPRWVSALRAACVPSLGAQLIAGAKGTPSPLIPRAKGHGMVPHFNGRSQNDAIERDPVVATEIYACVFSLYAAAELVEGQPRYAQRGQGG